MQTEMNSPHGRGPERRRGRMVSKVKSVVPRRALQFCTLTVHRHHATCVQRACGASVGDGERGCGMLVQ